MNFQFPKSLSKMLPGWLILLGAFTAVAPLSIDMYLPSFPEIERALNAPLGSMEISLALFFIGMAVGQLFYGPLSDRFGRKPPLFFGFALYTFASVGCILSTNVTMFWICRFLQGASGSAGVVVPRAIVRDRTSARETARAFSMLMLVMGLAPVLAPLIGGWLLNSFGWRAIFVVLAMFGSLCLAAIAFGVSETNVLAHRLPMRATSVANNYACLLRNRIFLGFSLAGGLSMAGMFAYIAGSPFVLIQIYGVQPKYYGWLFGANAFGLIAASQVNARLLSSFGATEILRVALFVPAVAGMALAVFAYNGIISLPSFVIGSFCFVASMGCIAPNALAAALSTHGQMAGTAAALASALQFLFATFAGALVGVFHDGTAQPLAIVMALCGCGAWLSHRLLVSSKHDRLKFTVS